VDPKFLAAAAFGAPPTEFCRRRRHLGRYEKYGGAIGAAQTFIWN